MKKVFADTHILVDLIAGRHPFSKYAIELFRYKVLAPEEAITELS